MDLQHRTELAVRGVRVAAPVRRTGGAGPSDDGHVRLDGLASAIPLLEDSPWTVDEAGRVTDGDGLAIGLLEPVDRPAFYDGVTADGVPYEQIARLHGGDVLATTVVQTCVRYPEATRCRFCAIEESLAAGSTVRVKTPAQLAEVARAAHRLDGVRQAVLTTGTSATEDRGARHLARCVRAMKDTVPSLSIQVQCEPPGDLRWISHLHDAGADAIGIHVESMDDRVRARWMPGKATVPLDTYWEAWHEAVRVFGHNRVSTYLLVGLGEDRDELVQAAAELAEAGVYPFVVPYRPLNGTLAFAGGDGPPDPDMLADVTERIAAHLHQFGMRGADQRAGCAACGACSALAAAGA